MAVVVELVGQREGGFLSDSDRHVFSALYNSGPDIPLFLAFRQLDEVKGTPIPLLQASPRIPEELLLTPIAGSMVARSMPIFALLPSAPKEVLVLVAKEPPAS